MDSRTIWDHTSKLVELAGSDAPLPEVLTEVVNAARLLTEEQCRVALFIHDLDNACLNLGANGGMPDGYVLAIQGFKVGEHQPSCGRAAFIGDEVIVPDLSLDSRWAPCLDLAQEYSIKACWSFPILSSTTVLGTLAVYHDSCTTPVSGQAEALRYLATIASAAIGRSQVKAAVDQAALQPTQRAEMAPAGARTGHGLPSLRRYVASASGVRDHESDR